MKRFRRNYYREEICYDCGQLESRWSAFKRAVRYFFNPPVLRPQRPLTPRQAGLQAILGMEWRKAIKFPANLGGDKVKIYNTGKLLKSEKGQAKP